MTSKEELKQLNEKIKKVKEQKASVLAQLENLAKQKLPRKVKKAKREPLQKEWQRLWDELKSLYAKRKIEDLKEKKAKNLRELKKVEKDPNLSEEKRRSKTKELLKKWQLLRKEIDALTKVTKEEKSEEEKVKEFLQKSNIDEKYVDIVKEMFRKTENSTPEEIKKMAEKEVRVGGVKDELRNWSITSYKGNIMPAWRSIQRKKSKIYTTEMYRDPEPRYLEETNEKERERFEASLVRSKVLASQYYKKQGIDELKLYRGVIDAKGEFARFKLTEAKKEIRIGQNPVSSWSRSRSVANDFGEVTIAKKIPVERVVLSFEIQTEGFPDQDEEEVVIDVEGLTIRPRDVTLRY